MFEADQKTQEKNEIKKRKKVNKSHKETLTTLDPS